MEFLAVAVQDDDAADDADAFGAGGCGQFRRRFLRRDGRALQKHFDFDELPRRQGLVHAGNGGLIEAVFADLEDGLQGIGLRAQRSPFFAGQYSSSFSSAAILCSATLRWLLSSLTAAGTSA